MTSISTRSNRRRAERIRLSESVVARLGTQGAVLIDLSILGARVEHYSRLRVGDVRLLRLDVGEMSINLRATVVNSRIHRFAAGDDGLTVYRSGLDFSGDDEQELGTVGHFIEHARAETLTEQIANAKGFAPPSKGEMPIFRGGALTSNDFKVTTAKKDAHLIPDKRIAKDVGFVRYAKKKDRWTRVWTLDRSQPEEGFTVSANESADQIELLCKLYRDGDRPTREMIRLLATTSIEEK
ncbi:MAG: PilZ domain-containing protein [Acidobacteria bacterium]|nr:PilZ domain-containing protein [Acidobacteriota bacterium]